MEEADLLWSFFVAAVNSYRRDSVLRPFPQDYLSSEGEKEFEKLMHLVNLCPTLSEVNKERRGTQSQLIKLLRWVLNPKNFSLKHLNGDKFRELHSLVANINDDFKLPKPDYIFEVAHSTSQDQKFKSLQGDSRLLYAFHGSKVENFYSILNHGLRNNLNKVALYGEGIYLSSDLSIALNYSPQGQGWNRSIFGNSLSCIALCEMIDHPDVKCSLKCERQPPQNLTAKEVPLDGSVRQDNAACFSSASRCNSSTDRSRIKGSEGGRIPEKYFVVRNDDLIRVKYLFLYSPCAKQYSIVKYSIAGMDFLRRHQFFLSMLLYVFILLFASFCNSKKFNEWWRSMR